MPNRRRNSKAVWKEVRAPLIPGNVLGLAPVLGSRSGEIGFEDVCFAQKDRRILMAAGGASLFRRCKPRRNF